MPSKPSGRSCSVTSWATRAAWIADIGLKAGLFRAIADSGNAGVTEEALAERLDYKVRYVQVWCRGAYAFEFLDWDERSGYRLAPYMESLLLDPTDPQFTGGRLQFYTALYEDYRAFPEYLRTGGIWPRSDHDPFLIEALKNLTKPDCGVFTEQVLPQAPETLEKLERAGRILDVGAGGGHHAVHYAKRFPQRASRRAGIRCPELDTGPANHCRSRSRRTDRDPSRRRQRAGRGRRL